MKKVMAFIGAVTFLSTSSAFAQSKAKEYYDLRMEAQCERSNRGVEAIGIPASAVPIPVVVPLFSFFATDGCYQWRQANADANLAKFEKENPGLARAYARTVASSGRCENWPSGFKPSGC